MTGLLDLLKKAKPEELTAAREVLATLPAAPQRLVMPAEERRSLGAELARLYEAVIVRGAQAHEAQRTKLETVIAEARASLERLEVDRADTVAAYSLARDAKTRRLWEERPAVVDAVLAELEAEARALVPASRTVTTPPDRRLHMLFPRPLAGKLLPPIGAPPDPEDVPVYTLTNARHVEARRHALRDLSELVREWTCKGVFADELGLRRLLAAERAKLPNVPTLEELAQKAA